jgi:hypothetical protein
MDLRRHVPFFGSAETTRFCYARVATLEKALKNSRILDGLIKQLQVPGKSALHKAMSDREKLRAIEEQIESYTRAQTSIWYKVNPAEVLAASIFRATLSGALPQKAGVELWCAVRKENALAGPVAAWLKTYKLQTYLEVPMGSCRADVVGYRAGGLLSDRLSVVVELKNEREQLKRGLDQMTTFAEYAHETYLACTPFFAASYLDHHAEGVKVKHWDADVLKRKGEAFGVGLLLVEGDDVYEVLKPKRRVPADRHLDDLRLALSTARAL